LKPRDHLRLSSPLITIGQLLADITRPLSDSSLTIHVTNYQLAMAAISTGEEKHPQADHAEGGDHGDMAGDWKAVNESGRQAALIEHELTLKQAFKAYPGAIMWSVLVPFTTLLQWGLYWSV